MIKYTKTIVQFFFNFKNEGEWTKMKATIEIKVGKKKNSPRAEK